MKSHEQDPLESFPVLTHLRHKMESYRHQKMVAALLRALFLALTIHCALLSIFGWQYSRHPFDIRWVIALLAIYGVYIIPILIHFLKLQNPLFSMKAIASELDQANSGAPDIFRTIYSLDNHPLHTWKSLNHFFSPLIPGLIFPVSKILSWQKVSIFICVLSLSGSFIYLTGNSREILYRMALPLSAWKNRELPEIIPVKIPQRIALGDTLSVIVHLKKVPEHEILYGLIRTLGREFRLPMHRQGDSASLIFGAVEGDLQLNFSVAEIHYRTYRIESIVAPHFKSFSVILQPPQYTHAPIETLLVIPPHFLAPFGSQLIFAANPSEKKSQLKIVNLSQRVSSDSAFALKHSDEATYFSTRLLYPIDLQAYWVTPDGIKGKHERFHVEPVEDKPPEITLLTPEGEQTLGRALKVPVVFRAIDDFGISKVGLVYSVFGDGLKSEGRLAVTSWLRGDLGGGVWDLDSLSLYPGNVVEMHLEATDNNAIGPPKTSVSNIVRLRMPSLEEILAQISKEENSAATSLRSAVEREENLQRQAERTGKSSTQEGPPPPGPWEVERVLGFQPREHLKRVKHHLEAEKVRTGPTSPLGKQLQGLQREVEQMEKRLPLPEPSQKPIAEQLQSLEKLNRDQKNLQQKMAGLKPLPPPKDALEQQLDRLTEERKRLSEELEKNLRDQEELRDWLKDQLAEKKEANRQAEKSSQTKQKMQEDVNQAMEQIQKSMDKAAENGLLSPDLLEKMERIKALLKEALPDSVRDKMTREAENQEVGMEELQKNLQKMLESGDGLRENLDKAIRMLEALRKIRGLENLAQTYRDLEKKERDLSAQLTKKENLQDIAAQQEQIRNELGLTREAKNKVGQEEKEFHNVLEKIQDEAADLSMREAGNKIKNGDRTAASKKANIAAENLGQSAQSIESFLKAINGGPDANELSQALWDAFDFSHWVETVQNRVSRLVSGWSEGDVALLQRGAHLAQGLSQRWKQLADAKPFDSDVLRKEANIFTQLATTLDKQGWSGMDSLLVHSRKAQRELLKWLEQSKNEAASAASASGGEGNSGQAKSKGSGQAGGMQGASQRLRGLSGKQMAVNEATQQLLQSYLQGRLSAQGPRGQTTGGGESGSQSGDRSGSSSDKNPAAQQQSVGESLEQLAESESDAGGAARKLRKLAEEARGLEKALREGRMGGEEIKQRQNRFQTRLLEAATALEERGLDSKREANPFRGDIKFENPSQRQGKIDWFAELKRRHRKIKDLNLTQDQRRHVEWYYENLLKK